MWGRLLLLLLRQAERAKNKELRGVSKRLCPWSHIRDKGILRFRVSPKRLRLGLRPTGKHLWVTGHWAGAQWGQAGKTHLEATLAGEISSGPFSSSSPSPSCSFRWIQSALTFLTLRKREELVVGESWDHYGHIEKLINVYLLYCGQSARCSTWIISFNPHNPTKHTILSFPF